ncbi:NAD(P)-dependent dehydrogenase (short-subunit alcohol dehydrogenase family) [Litoreibacter meonggei]|uniref:NAD(P)-dependent dehydrogenase (Short-subunit alcohol dehydrogenase family) n=1 Tax=Litoreibacter meonggei TaxID=1049199 RepID=A0A497VL90_9RHOB|nr:SDR family NAD(P)-dependent oxidoreductase [Litoreibacter meonggei]RLJ40985.1 NAD(P)-dependent dehydrogenase (short-subunit alcohol dehydrogenase family) [Litoreibacter meonggei]
MTASGLATDLAGKHVIVTGGATGIGAAVVAAFADQGARVSFLDINRDAGEALAEALEGSVTFHEADLTEVDAVQTLLTSIVDQQGCVDVLVNGAANDTRHQTAEITPEMWRKTLAVNLDHQFFCTQAVLPAMRAQKHGVILNFGSIAWREGLEDAMGYVTAKAGIEGLTRALARELGPDGIRVNCLLPGFVKTERQVEKWLTPELHKTVMERQCLKRFTEASDVADAAVFLCSNAARAVTNQTLIVDAGWAS